MSTPSTQQRTQPTADTTPPRRAFTAQEVSEQLGITADQVRYLIRSGRLRARHTGKRYIIPVSALEEFLAGADEPLAAGGA